MRVEDTKELINTIFEGLISLVVVAGSGVLISVHSDSTAIVGAASAAAAMVLTFWFGQRGSAKAVNGNITALSNIASNLIMTSQAPSMRNPQAPDLVQPATAKAGT